MQLTSCPPEAIAAYVFAQYFFLGLIYAAKVAGTAVHLGYLVLGLGIPRLRRVAAVLIMSDSN